MSNKRILQVLLIIALWLLVSANDCRDKTYTIDVISLQKISDTAGNFNGTLADGDQFGSAVAVIGDLNFDGISDLTVGAPLDDDGGTDRGAAWVLLINNDGSVSFESKISDTAGNFTGGLDDGDRFGSSVAEIGDMNLDGALDIAVGAPLDDDGGTDRGAVWILFLTDSGSVIVAQKISATAGNFPGILDDNDQFGFAVTNIGDLNSDGITDLAVGAPLDDDGGTDRGAIWILLMNTDGTVGQSQKISSTTGGFNGTLSNNDFFGSAIADIGDLNADGLSDIAVGARGDDEGGTDRGAVWLITRNADNTVKGEFKIADASGNFNGGLADGDHFGHSLANLSDINGDGINDMVVGASGDDDGGTNRGAMWILFMERDGHIVAKSKISSTQGSLPAVLSDNDEFGNAVASIGNFDSRGTNDFIAGARGDNDGGTDRGALWTVFMSSPIVDINFKLFDRNK